MAPRGKVIRFPRRPPEPAAESGAVEVHRCDRAEALVVRGLLESEGIPTLLRSQIAQSVHPFSVGSLGEVAVLVPGAEAARSRLILARLGAGPSVP
jgi:putative signal transducing protein